MLKLNFEGQKQFAFNLPLISLITSFPSYEKGIFNVFSVASVNSALTCTEQLYRLEITNTTDWPTAILYCSYCITTESTELKM